LLIAVDAQGNGEKDEEREIEIRKKPFADRVCPFGNPRPFKDGPFPNFVSFFFKIVGIVKGFKFI